MLYIGSDHAGLPLKEKLLTVLAQAGIAYQDLGAYTDERVDYVAYGVAVCRAVQQSPGSKGLLVCGSGIGMSIVANKMRGIRAALCHDVYSARLTREHNDTNILCMGCRVVGEGLAADVLLMWLSTNFDGGRHQTRLDAITALESGEG